MQSNTDNSNSKERKRIIPGIECCDGPAILQFMKDFRNNLVACDAILVASDDAEFPVHKVVLTSSSEYFKAMFSAGFKEQQESRITLPNIDSSTLNTIIDFIYGSKIVICDENIMKLLESSDFFGMTRVKTECCNFIIDSLDLNNCCEYLHAADRYRCRDLLKHCQDFIKDNFSDFQMHKSFFELPSATFETLLKSNDLNVQSEEMVYNSVIKWVKHDVENRKIFMNVLMKNVRLPLLSPAFLIGTVAQEPLIRASLISSSLLIEACSYNILPQKANIASEASVTRNHFPKNKEIFICGGKSGDRISEKAFLFSIEKEHKFVTDPPLHLYGCRAVGVSGSIYVLGGFRRILPQVSHSMDTETATSLVVVFDTKCGLWSPSPSMIQPRGYFGVVFLNNCIYTIGGQSIQKGNTAEYVSVASFATNEVFEFSLTSKKWVKSMSMSSPRSYLSAVECNGYIYAIGGCFLDGSTKKLQHLHSVEQFNPQQRTWRLCANMNCRRSNAGVAVFCGKIFVVGGSGDELSQITAEIFDPLMDMWTFISFCLPTPLKSAVVHSVNEYLYIFGGKTITDDKNEKTLVGKYCPKTNYWTPSVRQLPYCISSFASAIVQN